MSLLVKATPSKDFQILEQGTHLAICNAVIGVGLQETPWGTKEKVYIRWEVPSERLQYEKDGQKYDVPITIWANYTLSLSEKSNLRQDLEGWRGCTFTKLELEGFELFNVSGAPCLLTIVHNESNGRTFANVQSISRVMKGLEIPSQEIKSITYSTNSTEQWDDVPEWLKEKIPSRVEKKNPTTKQPDEFIGDRLEIGVI